MQNEGEVWILYHYADRLPELAETFARQSHNPDVWFDEDDNSQIFGVTLFLNEADGIAAYVKALQGIRVRHEFQIAHIDTILDGLSHQKSRRAGVGDAAALDELGANGSTQAERDAAGGICTGWLNYIREEAK